jgi:hypothetical protein
MGSYSLFENFAGSSLRFAGNGEEAGDYYTRSEERILLAVMIATVP